MKHRYNHQLLRTICILAAVMSTIMGQAQVHDNDAPVYDSTYPDRMIEMEVHADAGLSTIMQNYGDAIPGLSDMQLSPGMLMGGGLKVRFALRNSFAIGTGLSMSINNFKYALSLIEGNTGSINSIYLSNHFYEVEVPVYMQWRLNMGRYIKHRIEVGVYLAKGLGGNMDGSGYTSGTNSLGQPVINHVTYNGKYFKDGLSMINGVKDTDWGPRIATGLIYRNHYSLGLIFQLSASNLAINYNVLGIKYRNLKLAFEFGYIF